MTNNGFHRANVTIAIATNPVPPRHCS
ncbi:MAG: hypothetical protein UZ18_ATM001001882, partial [Armatimonadetes bacterium OLB18]